MTANSTCEELNVAIDQMLADSSAVAKSEPQIAEFLAIVSDLLQIPSSEFKTRLKNELLWQQVGYGEKNGARVALRTGSDFLSTLLGTNAAQGTYAVRRGNFVVSAGLHLAAAVLIVTLTLWVRQHPLQTPHENTVTLLEAAPYIATVAPTTAGGGGGGGTAEKISASKGVLPRSARQQIVPPTVIVANNKPKLAADPAIMAPNIEFPKDLQNGNPLAALLTPSNGTGIRGGIGSSKGTGVGGGDGAGLGFGIGGGINGGIYHVGNGVSAPRVIYDPDPEYSDEARKAKFQGTVIIWAVIGTDGRVHTARLQHPAGLGLDQRALEAVRTWRFQPAIKDGRPVPVAVNIEVAFRLY